MTQPKTRHVFVRPPNIPVEQAGLLIEWRQYDGGDWHALVVYVDRAGRAVTEWVPVERVRPVMEE